MKLTLPERLVLTNILPEQSDFITLSRIQDAKNLLIPTELEVKEFEIVMEEGIMRWSANVDTEVDIKIGEVATDSIFLALKKLNDDKQLEAKHLSLYEKFVASPLPPAEQKTESPETNPLDVVV